VSLVSAVINEVGTNKFKRAVLIEKIIIFLCEVRYYYRFFDVEVPFFLQVWNFNLMKKTLLVLPKPHKELFNV